MFESLFGAEVPLPLRFFVAFVIVLGLIGGAAYLVRRFGAGALNAAAIRGRQPRLAVIDSAPVDNRRRLVLVRRDNVEHLILIGGPSDVLIEPNIIRAMPAAAQRDIAPARAAENLPRPVPLPDGNWVPEPVAPRPQSRPVPAATEDGLNWPLQPEPAARAPAEPPLRNAEAERIAGLAANLSRTAGEAPPRRVEPRRAPPPTPAPPPQSADDKGQETAHILETALRKDQPVPPPAPPVRPEPVRAPEPVVRAPEPLARPEPFVRAEPVVRAPEPVVRIAEPAARANEAAAQAKAIADLAAPLAPRSVEPRAPRGGPMSAAKPAYDSLEQEMASLLGRPTGKT